MYARRTKQEEVYSQHLAKSYIGEVSYSGQSFVGCVQIGKWNRRDAPRGARYGYLLRLLTVGPD